MPNFLKLNQTSFIVISIFVHTIVFVAIEVGTYIPPDTEIKQEPVKVKIVTTEKKKPVEEKITPPKKPQFRKTKKIVKKNARKVQGVTKESLAREKSSGPAVPLGNTLMAKDEGKRLSADEISGLQRDLSSDAILIQDTFNTPQYTQAALDADLEGRYPLDVYVSHKGEVVKAELVKKIGFGMDARVIEAITASKFIPKKNAKGSPESGWVQIRINLEIP